MNPVTIARRGAVLSLCLMAGLAQAQLPGLPGATQGDMTIGLASGDQVGATLASGDEFSLLLWADERSNPYIYHEYETSSDIYGLRVDQSGTPQEDVPFAVTALQATQSSPRRPGTARTGWRYSVRSAYPAPATTTSPDWRRCASRPMAAWSIPSRFPCTG